MIRLGKPVQLLEWGQGTNTTNQVWTKFAEGTIEYKPQWWNLWRILLNILTTGYPDGQPHCVDGITDVVVAIEGKLHKRNSNDDVVKIMQQGEGMTPASQKWGEVAMGTLSNIEETGGKTLLHIALRGATKAGRLVK